MRMSDWSSDVCSSDLQRAADPIPGDEKAADTRGQQESDPGHHADQPVRLVAPVLLDQNSDQRRQRDHANVAADHRQHHKEYKPPQRDALDLHRSEEHTSELKSLMRISYAVFCLKKKKT